ncbi:MAG: N-glycosylase/DNA lyase [Candidatus Omnitrophica bacterium]|nr:N-glycosylase/DNA lyase [Candidatus Omnitrophota bacterium]
MKNELHEYYGTFGPIIKARLDEFRMTWERDDREIFAELCFCICTPQSKAVLCDEAVKRLVRNDVLYNGTRGQLRKGMRGVRFPNNKTRFILEARSFFSEGSRLEIKKTIDPDDVYATREWLVKEVKGLGYKEASHFLRNIGLGERLAILDVHILRNMAGYGIIPEVPGAITKKRYYALEEKFRAFAGKAGIPMAELDLLLWAKETGMVFK